MNAVRYCFLLPALLFRRIVPWVPEVFLACSGNFRCWLKADTSSKTWQKPETALEKSLAPREAKSRICAYFTVNVQIQRIHTLCFILQIFANFSLSHKICSYRIKKECIHSRHSRHSRRVSEYLEHSGLIILTTEFSIRFRGLGLPFEFV